METASVIGYAQKRVMRSLRYAVPICLPVKLALAKLAPAARLYLPFFLDTSSMNAGPDATLNEVALPRDAATVLLLRDAPGGFEVFMVKRSGLSDVLGEAHVFPGGKIDAADSSPAMLACIAGLETLDLAALGEDLPHARAAGMFVAAARETFEEAGVLLVQDAAKVSARQLAGARDRLNAKEPFAGVLAGLNLKLDASALAPWVRWVTPTVLARRFDARFFLALAPPDQTAVHDDHEATHSEWLTPQAAVARWERDEIKLAPPTFMSLQHLARFDSMAAAFADARARRPPVIQPLGFDLDGVRTLALPGDEKHETRQQVIPGPVRLRYDGARYVPA